MTFVGDIIHVAAVQFPQPNVTIAYDEDQTAPPGCATLLSLSL